MNISHTFIILCNIVLSYSLIKRGLSTAYKINIQERQNFTLRPPIQSPKIIVQKPLISKKYSKNKNDNTTSVRINVNPDPLIPDSSSRAHLVSMLFI